VRIQNTATNSGRCIAWPTGPDDLAETPPAWFLLNGLKRWSEGVSAWVRQHVGLTRSISSSVPMSAGADDLAAEVDRLCDFLQTGLLTKGPSVVPEVYRRFAALWDGLHSAFDAVKPAVASGCPTVTVELRSACVLLRGWR
jgi:hypothetical protein